MNGPGAGQPASATAIAAAVTAAELDPVATVERSLGAIDAHADLNAILTRVDDEALSAARARPAGRLAGVPLIVKDVFDTAGVRTTTGSRVFAERVPDTTAPAVEALLAEGAIMIGKANCDEFAWGVTGQNAWWGDTQNPRLPGHIAGGSSSGNAAALRAGIAPIAIGTDTGGSVRMPAACCGVAGMKPPLGGIPTGGVMPFCPSFDTVGPMARTVADCALLYSVLTGLPVPEPAVNGLTVGVLTVQPPLGPVAPDAAPPERDDRALASAARLEALGARTLEIGLPVPEADTWAVFYSEAAESHRELFPARREEYGATLQAKLDAARRVDPAVARAAHEALLAWRARAAIEPAVDLIVSPTLGVDEIPPIDVDELEIRLPFSAYTRVFNYLGWPAMAIGGVQIAGRDQAQVLAAALAWEEAYGAP